MGFGFREKRMFGDFLECLKYGHDVELQTSAVEFYPPNEWVFVLCRNCSESMWVKREKSESSNDDIYSQL